ncbi:MAG: hypothetical protein ACLQVA_10705 [Candidatus Brocadiia bacterium]
MPAKLQVQEEEPHLLVIHDMPEPDPIPGVENGAAEAALPPADVEERADGE